MRRALLLPLALGCLTALPGACGPAPPVAHTAQAGAQRIELRPRERQRLPETRLVARLSVPRALHPWRTDAAEHRVESFALEPGAAPSRFLFLTGGERSVLVPGPFDGRAFTQLVLELHSTTDAVLSVELLRAGEAILSAGPLRVRGENRLQTLSFDLPAARFEPLPFDGLRLVVRSRGACRLGRLDLVDRPLAAWLPPAGRDPLPVRFGEDARPALGISSSTPLVARVRMPPGGILSFAAQHLAELGPPGQGVRLELELLDRLGRRTHQAWPLQAARGRGRPWQELSLALGRHGGYEVELTFTLVSERSAEAFALLTPPIVHVPAAQPPVVLLITADGLRSDHLGAHPAGVGIETPTLDGLAAAGRTFEECWAVTDSSPLAHAALLAGRLSARAQDPEQAGFDAGATLAERFRDAGWATVAVVSASDLAQGGLGRGFERLDAPVQGTRPAGRSIERALALMKSHADRPLFLLVHLADARPPFEPPREHLLLNWPAERGHPFDPALPVPDLPRRVLPSWLRNLRRLDFASALYRGEITYLDGELARLVSEPRIAGGVIAFTAGHGMGLGQQGVFWDHRGLHPEILRVPLILVGPGLEPPARVARAVSQLDLGRTLLDLAGLARAAFPGRSLLRPGADEPRYALAEGGRAAALAMGSWLYVRQLLDDDANSLLTPRRAGAMELYDLAADPDCEHNLAPAEPGRAMQMDARLRAWLEGEDPP